MSNFLTRRHLLAAGTALSCSTILPTPSLARESAARIQQVVQQIARTAVESGDIPGVIAQVWRKGELCADASAGWMNIERKVPMDHNAIFGLASMTKPVTVALALRLVDAGQLKLDDPITKWMPEFAQMRVLRRPDGPLDDTVPATRAITVEDLMTHRSGLAYGFLAAPPLGPALLQRVGYGIDSNLTPDQWLKTLAEVPLMFQPGERFNYGHSIDVLGFLAARVLGKDLGTAMHDELFAPLGMVDTGFWVPEAKRARLATFYVSPQLGQFGLGGVSGFTAAAPAAFASGGQGLVSTAADYLRFAQMLLHDGSRGGVRVLKPETVRLMRSNHFTPEQRKFPFVAGGVFNQGFGLGMSVIIDPKQPAMIAGGVGTFGWPGAFGGWWQADPQEDMILIWLQQCTPAPPQPGGPLPRLPGMQSTQQFRAAVYEAIKGEVHANAAG
jgi:CubicO group peptidase (beta-lactamase class C family)